MKLLAMSAALMLAGSGVPAAAQTYATSSERLALNPGEFVWFGAESLTPVSARMADPVTLVVSIPAQLLYVYRGDALIGISTVSTGKPGKDTPTGDFTILQKSKFHRSNLYSNAPMPFMQRLTWDGIALHAGKLPGYPASHGCIRLPHDFARALFDITRMGANVRVVDWAIDDPLEMGPRRPRIDADPAQLIAERFNNVTANTTPPPALVPVRDGSATSTSWATGPVREIVTAPPREIVQPLPAGR